MTSALLIREKKAVELLVSRHICRSAKALNRHLGVQIVANLLGSGRGVGMVQLSAPGSLVPQVTAEIVQQPLTAKA